jgi:hypothetical protein
MDISFSLAERLEVVVSDDIDEEHGIIRHGADGVGSGGFQLIYL